jgi:anti-sigma-K factor RskA
VALGAGLWSMHLTGRVSRAERQQAQTAELISAVTVPDSKIVQLASADRVGKAADVAAVYVPRRGHLYVVGNMTRPSSDRVYQVWLGRSGLFASGGTFVPGPEGFVLVRIVAGKAAYDHVLITEESADGSDHPSDHRIAESDL